MAKRGLTVFWVLVFAVMLAACGSDSNSMPFPGFTGSEGSMASPLPVATGSPRAGYAGAFPSYYYFNASVAGTYTISLTGVNADVGWDLYGPSGFSDWIDWCDDNWSATDESCDIIISTTGTYYLEVVNWDSFWGVPTATYFLTITPPEVVSGCSGPGTCFDFEDGLVPAGFVNSADSDAAWTVDNTRDASGSGTNSLRSGAVGHSQKSCVEYAPAGDTSSVSFNLMTSSEQYYDHLRFYIDDVQQAMWSGDTAWTRRDYSPVTGAHTYKWCYEKDSSYSDGADSVWVDDIEVQ